MRTADAATSLTPLLLVSILVIGSAALVILGIQPLLLGALVDEGRLTLPDLGRVATVEILLLALGSTLGPRIVGQTQIRGRSLAIGALFALAQIATIAADGAAAIGLVRGAAGLLGGLLLGGVISVITRAPDPDRIYGLFYGVITIPQAVAGYALPTIILPEYASTGGFLILALMACAATVSALLLKGAPAAIGRETPRPIRIWTPPVLLACLAVVLQNAAVGAIWSYVDRIAVGHGFSGEVIGQAFGVSLLTQIAAGFAVAWAGSRIPYAAALILGLIVQAVFVAIIAISTSPGLFVVIAALFGFLWVGLLPYYIALMIDFDRSRGVAMLMFGVGIAGFSFGPFTASFIVSGTDASSAAIVAITFFMAAAAAYAISILLHRRMPPEAAGMAPRP